MYKSDVQNNKLKCMTICVLFGIITAGCSSVGNGSQTSPVDSEAAKSKEKAGENLQPATINIYNTRKEISDNWDALMVAPLRNKYPHITVNEVKGSIAQVITSGTPVDLYITPDVGMGDMVQADFTEDIEPLLKANKFDLNRFNPAVIQTVRSRAADRKQLVAVPFYLQFNTLYYNKDIFNMFGVPYPKDGMTWDEAITLARKVTGSRDGIKYYGLRPDQVQRLAAPLGAVEVDAATNKSIVLSSDKFRRAFDLSKQIYSIPGNLPNNAKEVNTNPTNLFAKDKALAMYFSVNRFSSLQTSDVNWDMTQSPYYPEYPNIGGDVDSFVIGVAKTSKHKEDAVKVIDVFRIG